MERNKYPRTYHLPYSQSKTDDDKTLPNDDQFKGIEVVVTIKMDGENTTVYPDGYVHARSLDGTGYEWQNWLKSYVWNFCGALEDDELRKYVDQIKKGKEEERVREEIEKAKKKEE